MKIYKLQLINKAIKSEFIKNSGIWIFHILNFRYLTLYLDPVLSCNLRCRSCYFSDEEQRKTLNGAFKKEDIEQIAKAVFRRTLRLQIGCGAEPAIFKYNSELIQQAKTYGVKYISITSNANLLTAAKIDELLKAGLDELTISIHGVKKHSYEYLMVNASYEKLKEVLHNLTEAKQNYPDFKLRLNYTINNLNVDELNGFFDEFGFCNFDILQLRALRDIGGEIKSVETDEAFNLVLNENVTFLKKECKKRNILLLEPDKFEESESNGKEIKNFAYGYISPKTFIHNDFDWRNETFNQFSKRTGYSFQLLKSLFNKEKR